MHIATFVFAAATLLGGCSIASADSAPTLLEQLNAVSPSMLDQYDQAHQVFLGDTTDQQSYSSDYAKVLFSNLEGDWVPLDWLGSHPTPSAVHDACENGPYDIIQLRDAYSFYSTRVYAPGKRITTLYTLRYGSLFGGSTDLAAALKTMGYDAPGQQPSRMGEMARLNGAVAFWRFSPDILVSQAENGMPGIYGRCSAAP